MKPRHIVTVYAKELRDTLRDRRTVIWSIVFPVVALPLLMLGMLGIAAKMAKKATLDTAPIVLLGEENAPELARRLRGIERFEFVDAPAELDEAVGNKEVRAVIELPPAFDDALAAGERPKIEVRYHDGEFRSEATVHDISRAVLAYRQELVHERLAGYGLGERDLEPFVLEQRNVASKKQVTAQTVGGLIPYMIILMCLVGAMFPAIDITAGEKERGTMETILASSVGRLDLVLGKFFSVMTASLATVVLSLGSLAVTAMVILPRLAGAEVSDDMQDLVDMARQVDLTGVLGMLVLVLPLTVLFSAALMSVALFARSLREAQQYVGPLPMIVIIPAMIGLLPGIELTTKTALIPITSTSLAAKELLAGSFDWPVLTLIFLSSCVYGALALFLAVKQFQREEVLFRT